MIQPLLSKNISSSIRIIGVDPSLADTGLCLLENAQILKTDHIQTRSEQEMPKRLEIIYQRLEEFFQTNPASCLAIEDQFLGSFYAAKSYGITERKNLKTIQGL
ncbi:MAG: crossover junction endodeoxyribonuclease RuvC, partial [Planctomycetota bacterium]